MTTLAHYIKPGTQSVVLQVIERTNDIALYNTSGNVIAAFPRPKLDATFATKRAFIAADALFAADYPGAPPECKKIYERA